MKRLRLVGMAAGLALLLTLSGEGVAGPVTKTPAPTATVSTTTPAGNQQSSPTIDATWSVARPGVEGSLAVRGKPSDTEADLAEPPPGPALFPTTVTATWTSNLTTFWTHDLGADVVLSWGDGMPQGSEGHQTLRVRYGNAKNHWGPWTTLYDKPLTDSTAAFFTTGGDIKVFATLRYPGKVPAKKMRVQFGLIDTLPQGGLLNQVLIIDLDPASHGLA